MSARAPGRLKLRAARHTRPGSHDNPWRPSVNVRLNETPRFFAQNKNLTELKSNAIMGGKTCLVVTVGVYQGAIESVTVLGGLESQKGRRVLVGEASEICAFCIARAVS